MPIIKSSKKFIRIFLLSLKSFFKNEGPTWAASIAYYSLLSIFPLLLAAVAIASYFVDAAWAVARMSELLGDFLPKGRREIEEILNAALSMDKKAGFFYMLLLFWTGTLVFGTITKALNVVFQSEKKFSYFKRVQIRVMMLIPFGFLFLLALGSEFFLRILKFTLGILPWGKEIIAQIIIAAVPGFIMFLAFFAAYRFLPRRRPGSKSAVIGALTAAILFVAAKPIFLGYVKLMGSENLIYGSLAGVVAGVVWGWVLAMIGIFGAQLSAHYEPTRTSGGPNGTSKES